MIFLKKYITVGNKELVIIFSDLDNDVLWLSQTGYENLITKNAKNLDWIRVLST